MNAGTCRVFGSTATPMRLTLPSVGLQSDDKENNYGSEAGKE